MPALKLHVWLENSYTDELFVFNDVAVTDGRFALAIEHLNIMFEKNTTQVRAICNRIILHFL